MMSHTSPFVVVASQIKTAAIIAHTTIIHLDKPSSMHRLKDAIKIHPIVAHNPKNSFIFFILHVYCVNG